MKKVLIFFLISLVPILSFGQSKFKRGISIGNDKTGSNVVTIDSAIKVGTNTTLYNGATRLNVTNDDTTALNTALTTVSTKAVIQTQIDESLASYGGGGGGSTGRYILSGRVGDTGFPTAGDSLIINTGFIAHPCISYLIRDGHFQQQHTLNTESDGFRFDGGTGTITVRPVFGANEQIVVIAEEPIVIHYLTAEGGAGGGGSPPDTPLQDSLLAVWEMDEVSGTTVDDAYGSNDGTTTATVNQTGKLGKSKLYNGITYSVIPNNATLLPDGDEMSISVWFYLTQLPSTAGHVMELVSLRDAQTPYYTAKIYLQATDNIAAYFVNSTGTVYEFETAASSVTTGQWYHLVAVNEGAAEDAKIYLNGTNVCSYHPTAFTGSLLQFDSVIYLGNRNNSEEYGVVGYLDQVAVYKQALTPADVTSLYNSGTGKAYPFN